MKLSIQSFARKLSIPSPKRTWSGGRKKQLSLSRSEAPSFGSASSSSDDALTARPSSTPRSVLRASSASEQIPRRELEAVLRRLGHGDPSDDDLAAFAAVVAGADAPAAPGVGGEEDDLMEAFRVFDADGDGRITAEELRAVMESILGEGAQGCSLDDCRRMIGGVDADGDGFVGFQDFSRMMMSAADARSLL